MFVCISLGTNDLDRSVRFYDATLAVLGLKRCDTSGEANWEGWAGWGTYEEHGARELALWVCTPFDGLAATPGNGTMVVLKAHSWNEVNDFHAIAIANGGTSEGVPGIRPQYQPDFYAAYVRDPDGNKISVVCRGIMR